MSNNQEDSLSWIIEGCKEGSSAAQKALYNNYKNVLMSICMRYLNDVDEAQDVLQDTFVKIFLKINQYKGAGSFEGWIKRIAVNLSLNRIKAKKKLSPHDSDFEREGDSFLLAEETEGLEDITDLKNAGYDEVKKADLSTSELMLLVDQLKENYKIVFNLYQIDGLSHQEISIELGIDEAASRKRLSRAKAQIKELVVKASIEKLGR